MVNLDLWIKRPDTEEEVEQEIFEMIKTNVEVERTSANLGLMKDAVDE